VKRGGGEFGKIVKIVESKPRKSDTL
jgi:hypothetical protein